MKEKLSEHCNIISGYAFKSSDLQNGTDIPVIKIGNISNGKSVLLTEDTQFVDSTFLKIDTKYHVHKEDILISLTGSHMNQPSSMVGRTCRNYNNEEYLLNQRAGKVIVKEDTDINYMYYLLSTDAMQYSIVNRAYGAANQVNVSPSDIMKIKWDFPRKEYQEKIGSILRKYDTLIEVNNKRIKALERMAENLYKEWFVRFRFPGHKEAEFENSLPKGWNVRKVKECVNRLPFGTLYKVEDTEPDGKVIVIDQSIDEYVGFHNNEASHNATEEKPIAIFGDHSCKNQLMITPFSLSENVIPYTSVEGIDTYYLYYSLRGIIETTEYKRHWSELVSKKILVAPLPLQIQFAKKMKTNRALVDYYKKCNRYLNKQRDLLLPRLMSGKLEV